MIKHRGLQKWHCHLKAEGFKYVQYCRDMTNLCEYMKARRRKNIVFKREIRARSCLISVYERLNVVYIYRTRGSSVYSRTQTCVDYKG